MRGLLLVAAGALAGCLEPDFVACANGVSCPAGTVCDEVHTGCVTPEQTAVCAGMADGTACTAAAIAGACFDEVCLAVGCGNRIVEPTEQCDDGNFIAGDGCSADCQSDETCGNGELDLGEQCDDDNVLSRDGCDSVCITETVAWSVLPLSITVTPSTAAYDDVRETLVVVADDTTWERSGGAWTATAVRPGHTGFEYDVYAVYYDPGRGGVVAITGKDTIFEAWLWSEGQWTSLGPGGFLPGVIQRATYDRARARPLVLVNDFNGATGWTLTAEGTWMQLPGVSIPTVAYTSLIGTDPSTGDVLLYTFNTSRGFRYNGTTFSELSEPLMPALGACMGNVAGRLLLHTSGKLYERTLAGWADLTWDVPVTFCSLLHGVPATGEVVLAEGVSFWQRSPTTNWNHVRLPFGQNQTAIAASPDGGFVLQSVETLSATGAGVSAPSWRVSPAGLTPITQRGPAERVYQRMVYAPGREAIVLAGGSIRPCPSCPVELFRDTWTFDANGWQQLSAVTVGGFTSVMTYDPVAGGVLFATDAGTQFLADDSTVWMPTQAPPASASHLAWDAREGHLVASVTGSLENNLWELEGGMWEQALLAPDGLFYVAADERVGSILWLPQAPFTQVFERTAGTWREAGEVPTPIIFAEAAYDGRSGTLGIVGSGLDGTIMLFRRHTSPTPDEQCGATDDDGDGLAGCADPDCYWASDCSRCPPYTTCL